MSPAIKAAARSLSARLVIAFVIAIVATTFAAGVPAYWLVRTELERQTWARVEDGGRVTLVLIEAEKAHLIDMAQLTAQRPTLKNLLQKGDKDSLTGYLQDFLISVDLDVLIVRDVSGQIIADGSPSSSWPDLPFTHAATIYPIPGSNPTLALLVSRSVLDDHSGSLLGFVTAGILLDDDFARQLAVETGLEQSIILDGIRVATSLENIPVSVEAESVGRAFTSGQIEKILVAPSEGHYYSALIPLADNHGRAVALIEVALPVDGLFSAEYRALLALILSTCLVTAIGSAFGAGYARRLTAPLRRLTAAALNISRGDLITPIPGLKEPIEVAALAAALEKSRVNTRKALDDLSQAKAWSDTLLQSIVEGIVTADVQGRITSFSQGAEYITGWSSDDVVGQPIDDVLHLADNSKKFTECMPRNGGKRQISVLTCSGRPVTLAVTGARLTPPGGGVIQIALVLRDITEEEAIRNLRSYFLTNVSHEFRTPLSALNASVELLLDGVTVLSRTEIGELLNSIHLSTTGLQTLIDNLLESSSIEAGRFTIYRRLTDFHEVVTEATRIMKPLLNRRQQHLSVTTPDRLPMVNIDSTRLTQVLVNLLSNASKYSPMGKGIDLSLKQNGDNQLCVTVADQGAGISPNNRANIFHRFVRLDTQDGTQYGVGLGLSVVKAIIQEHGGEVGVDERLSGGSVFWFTIPL